MSNPRIFPVVLDSSSIAPDVLALHSSWLQRFKGARDLSEPWVPVGVVGPLLMLAHHRVDAECYFPQWMCARVQIKESHYREAHAKAYANMAEAVSLLPPPQVAPQQMPPVASIGASLQCLREYFPLRGPDSIKLTALVSRNLTSSMPADTDEEIALAASYLLDANLRVADPRAIMFDDEQTRSMLPDGSPHLTASVAAAAPFPGDILYFLTAKVRDTALADILKARLRQTRRQLQPQLITCPAAILGAEITSRRASSEKSRARAEPGIRLTGEDTSEPDLVLEPEELESVDLRQATVTPNVLFKRFVYGAIRSGASDIHFEQVDNKARVRERVDGVMRVVAEVTEDRMRAMMSIVRTGTIPGFASNAFDAQDARCSVRCGSERLSLRASLKPHFKNGYQVLVLRILHAKKKGQVSLDKLGLTPLEKQIFRRAISRPSGLILVTGPTGSGKTTTLYACLSEVNTEDIRIDTMEDPVEIELPGATQSQINEKLDVTFAKLLRASLRQDPDIILVGEIRDSETAHLALDAACTGHLVLATLHATSEIDAISRMMTLIGDPRQFPVLASQLLLLQSQRLIPRLCHHCRQPRPLSDKEKAVFKKEQITDIPESIFSASPNGCKSPGCYHGYNGRTAIMSLLPAKQSIAKLVASGAEPFGLQEEARKLGFLGLYQHALKRVSMGTTSMEAANDWADPWADFVFSEAPDQPSS